MKKQDATESTTAPVYLTAAELRARWKVSGMFLHRMRHAGKLKAHKIGARGVRFAISEILVIEKQAAA